MQREQHLNFAKLHLCRYFDFDKLADITQQVTKNLNKIIDINYYPVETARRSNMRNRPIGIGVQVSITTYRACPIRVRIPSATQSEEEHLSSGTGSPHQAIALCQG